MDGRIRQHLVPVEHVDVAQPRQPRPFVFRKISSETARQQSRPRRQPQQVLAAVC